MEAFLNSYYDLTLLLVGVEQHGYGQELCRTCDILYTLALPAGLYQSLVQTALP